MIYALALPVALLAVATLVWASREPLRTVIPAYAFLVPIGGVFALGIPLPSPFNTLSSVVGALAVGATALHLVRTPRGRVPTLPVGLWILFVAWSALTFVWARDPGMVTSELLVAIPLVLLVTLVGMLPATWADLGSVRDAVIASGIAVGGWAALLSVLGVALPAHGLSARFSLGGSHTDPNQLAASLIFPLALSIDHALTGRDRDSPRWRGAFGPVGALLSAFAIALSGSRGGALAAVITIVVTLVLVARWRPWQRYRVRRALLGTAGAVLIVVVLGALQVALFPSNRLASVLSNTPIQRLVDTGSSSGRAEIWTTGVLACAQYCGPGVGMGNFTLAYQQTVAFSDVTRNVGTVRPAHDLYLEIGVETGVFGLALFFLAIVAEWRTIRLRGYLPLAAGLAASIVGFLLTDVFEGFLWFKHAWLPFMVIRVFEAASDTENASQPDASIASADIGGRGDREGATR